MSDSHEGKPRLAAGGHWPSHLRLWLVAAVAAAADLLTKQLAFDQVGWPSGLDGPGRIGGRHTVIDGFFDIETVFNPNAAMGLDARVFALLAGVICLVTAYAAFREKDRRRWLYGVSAVVACGFAVVALAISMTQDADAATQAQRWLFVGVMITIGLVFVGMFCVSKRNEITAHVALGLILAGDIGNLFDRIRHEYVRDFLSFNLPVIGKYPSFNLADAFLIIGVGLLILTRISLMVREGQEKKKAETVKASAEGKPKPKPRRKRR